MSSPRILRQYMEDYERQHGQATTDYERAYGQYEQAFGQYEQDYQTVMGPYNSAVAAYNLQADKLNSAIAHHNANPISPGFRNTNSDAYNAYKQHAEVLTKSLNYHDSLTGVQQIQNNIFNLQERLKNTRTGRGFIQQRNDLKNQIDVYQAISGYITQNNPGSAPTAPDAPTAPAEPVLPERPTFTRAQQARMQTSPMSLSAEARESGRSTLQRAVQQTEWSPFAASNRGDGVLMRVLRNQL